MVYNLGTDLEEEAVDEEEEDPRAGVGWSVG